MCSAFCFLSPPDVVVFLFHFRDYLPGSLARFIIVVFHFFLILFSSLHFESIFLCVVLCVRAPSFDQAVMDYAFKKTDYPVILSLENHCSLPQQQKMAQ